MEYSSCTFIYKNEGVGIHLKPSKYRGEVRPRRAHVCVAASERHPSLSDEKALVGVDHRL